MRAMIVGQYGSDGSQGDRGKTRARLNQWRMRDFDVGAGLAARAFEDDARSADWVSIAAPGDTYLALSAAGRLPDPFGHAGVSTSASSPGSSTQRIETLSA